MRFGACILSSDGPDLTPDEITLFRDTRPFGFILFARHVENPDQVRRLCDQMREAAGHDAIITVDQEGGRVQRFRAPEWREWLPPMDQAQFGARAMYLRARIMTHELKSLGLDSNCIPTLDVAGPTTHDFLYNRCFGTSPNDVIAMGRAVIDGCLDGGVLPVMKHMPGHGEATVDSHFSVPRVTSAFSDLKARDFAPFQALKDCPMGMTGHLVLDAVDDQPATLSAPVIDVIRSEIGFQGLLMTDDISMKALSGSLADRSRAALRAGCDVVLHCNDTFAERVEVASAAAEMSDVSQQRANAALAQRKTPDQIDISALEDEFEALVTKR